MLLIALTMGSTLVLGVPARAQAPAAEHLIGVTAGLVDVDLGSTGLYWGTAVRGTRALTRSLGLELGGMLTRYDSAPDATTVIVPEAQLHHHWTMGPARGYAGGGPGVVWSRRHGRSDTQLSLAAAAGVRTPVTAKLAVVVELRLRGVGRRFIGSTAELMGGVAWRLGSR
jgi:hypothetical protein